MQRQLPLHFVNLCNDYNHGTRSSVCSLLQKTMKSLLHKPELLAVLSWMYQNCASNRRRPASRRKKCVSFRSSYQDRQPLEAQGEDQSRGEDAAAPLLRFVKILKLILCSKILKLFYAHLFSIKSLYRLIALSLSFNRFIIKSLYRLIALSL